MQRPDPPTVTYKCVPLSSVAASDNTFVEVFVTHRAIDNSVRSCGWNRSTTGIPIHIVAVVDIGELELGEIDRVWSLRETLNHMWCCSVMRGRTLLHVPWKNMGYWICSHNDDHPPEECPILIDVA